VVEEFLGQTKASKRMNSTNPKLTPSEIAMIELMKLDDGFADYHENVDMSVPFEVRESYESAREKFLPRLLAERAKLYCRKQMDIPVEEVQSKWMRLDSRTWTFDSPKVRLNLARLPLLTNWLRHRKANRPMLINGYTTHFVKSKSRT